MAGKRAGNAERGRMAPGPDFSRTGYGSSPSELSISPIRASSASP